MKPMYKFQSKAVKQIVKGEPTYLGFDPGLGKSRTAIEAARQRDALRVLVICPASGRYVWEEQVKLWSSYPVTIVREIRDLKKAPGVYVVTYGLISQQGSPCVEALLAGEPFDMTILDEAAALKNAGANRTKAIFGRLLSKLGYVLPLSGTPAPNHAGELYPVLRALYPQALKTGGGQDLRQWEFEDLYCKVVMKRFGNGPAVRTIEGSRNIADLRSKLEGFMLRVRKEMVLSDLPAVRYDTVPLGVDYRLADTMDLTLPDMTNGDDDLLAYLRGVGGEHVMRLRRQLGLLKAHPSIEYIDDFMTNLPEGRKVLVFAHHKEVIDKLMTGLANWNPVKIDGAATLMMRAKAVNTFLTDSRCRIFVGNITASGTGFTLVGPQCLCSDVIFVEASYAVGENVQAAARVHRIGQQNAVVARFLTAHGTVDDRIQEILARKAGDFAKLFN